MSIGQILDVLYILVLFLSLTITMIIFVVWLVLKRPANSACENVLIASATLSVFLGLMIMPFHDYLDSRGLYPAGQSARVRDTSAQTKVDLAAIDIEKAEAFNLLLSHFPNFDTLAKFLDIQNETRAKANLCLLFKELPLKDRTKLEIIEREKVLDHALKQHFAKSFDSSAIKPDKAHRKLIAVLENIDKPSDEKQLSDDTRTIDKLLPDNFFRYQLLKSIYEREDQKALLAQLYRSHQLHVVQCLQKMIAGAVLTVICFGGGIIAVFVFKKILAKPPENKFENILNNITLKQIYGVGLGVYFVNFLIVIPFAVIAYILRALAIFGTTLDFYLLFICCALNVVLVLGFTALLVCSPLQIKITEVLRQLFSGNWMQSFAIALGAFCILRTSSAIFHYLVYLFFHSKLESNNPINEQLSTLSISPDPINAVLLLISIAIMAPFIEEFMLRGQLYTALRKRFGITAAVLLSALIFASLHRDLNSFIPIAGAGIAAAIIFERTRSLQACFLFHMIWNSSVALEAWLLL